MSRMTTSLASFSCASAAIRRACSSGVKLDQCPRSWSDSAPVVAGRAVEAARSISCPDRGAGRARGRPRRGRAGRGARARRSGAARGRRSATRSGCVEPLEHGVEPLARKPGRVATPSRTSRSTSSGSFQSRKLGELVGAEQEDGLLPLRVCAEHVDRARVRVERARRSPGNAARASSSARPPAVSTALCPGAAATTTTTSLELEALPRARASSATWPLCGGSKAPPKSADHGTNSNDSSPTSTSAPLRAPASRSARSSSSSLGGVPTTRKPPSVRSRLQGRAFGCGR